MFWQAHSFAHFQAQMLRVAVWKLLGRLCHVINITVNTPLPLSEVMVNLWMFLFLFLSCGSVLFGRIVDTAGGDRGISSNQFLNVNKCSSALLEVSSFSAHAQPLSPFLSVWKKSVFHVCCLMHCVETLQRNFCCLIEQFYTHSFHKLFGLCFLFMANGSFERKIYNILRFLKSFGAGNGMYQLWLVICVVICASLLSFIIKLSCKLL